MMDYKEKWQEMYEYGISLGMTEEESSAYADRQSADYFSSLADYYYEQQRESVQ